MLIETATIMEWSLAIAGMLGALAGVIKASNCRKISICKVIECEKALPITETELTETDNNSISNKIELKNEIESKV